MSPLVAKVPIQVHPSAQPKHLLVRRPVLPPQSVRSVRVLVPIRVDHGQNEEIKLVQQLTVARVSHQLSQYKCHRGWADPFSGMDACKSGGKQTDLQMSWKLELKVISSMFLILPPSINIAGFGPNCLLFLKQ